MKIHKYSKKVFRTILLLVGFLLIIFLNNAIAERLIVSASKANVRSGPGTEYDLLWEVEKYHPLVIIKKKGPWYQFRDFEGDEGWIHKKLLNSNAKAVITTKDKCNVRSGPGPKNKILFSAEKGIPFKVIQRKGKWIHVLHADGDKGWIHNSLVW